jgi:hypothetical protein
MKTARGPRTFFRYTRAVAASEGRGKAEAIVSRRRWFGLGIVLLLGAGFCVRRCQIDIAAPTAFSYGGHAAPRVFVSHRPLIPAPGSDLSIRLAPDLPSGASVRRAMAFLRDDPDGAAQSRDCPAIANGDFECHFSLSASAGVRVYGGSIELDNGDQVASRADYRFTVAEALPADALIEARVPLKAIAALDDTYRVDVAWVRDPQNYASEAFVADVEHSLYDGLLADPVYRWRDNQLGFYVFTRDGFVTSYYSGFDTRCGRNPWPRDATFPAALSEIEVVGVLHRKSSTSQGIEGRVTGPVGASLFRDCAGRAVRHPDVGTFSATTGIAESPLIAKHEFGHAAFGLGDEYSESDATRRVSPAPVLPLGGSRCCCAVSDGIGTTGGGTVGGTGTTGPVGTMIGLGTKRCAGPNGSIQVSPIGPLDLGLPACDDANSSIDPGCWSQPDGGCPSLAGDCVEQTPWLGQAAPAGSDATRPNVFGSDPACQDGRARAAAHPGIEDPARSLGTCRELCGPSTQACPCGASQFWIVDLDPGPTPPGPQDAMASITSSRELHGGTCTWCVETSLCVRWHRSLRDDAQTTWEACQAPPKSATGLERLWKALVQFIASLIGKILNLV